MSKIRDLFEASRSLDRRIEKVISFDSTENEQLKREVTEYVVNGQHRQEFRPPVVQPERRPGRRIARNWRLGVRLLRLGQEFVHQNTSGSPSTRPAQLTVARFLNGSRPNSNPRR